MPSTMQITQQSWCATAPALVRARPAFERNCGRKAYPGSCGTRLWIRHRTAPGRLTDFLRPSSGAGPQRRRRSGGSPAHCCGGGLLGETSGRHGAVWERRFSKNESRLAGGIPSGEAYGPPNGGYGVPAPTSGRICPATSWLSFPVQWDTHAGPAGPILQQSIDWRTRSCHTTFPLSPWAAPRIR